MLTLSSMKWPFLLPALVVLASTGCGEGLGGTAEEDSLLLAGGPDPEENTLVAHYAPEIHLGSDDWTRPADIAWYLQRVELRFENDECPSDRILARGAVNQRSLLGQARRVADLVALPPCSRSGNPVRSDQKSPRFYLTPTNKATRAGAPPSDWRIYVHAWKNKDGSRVIQYWFFYAYNDGPEIVIDPFQDDHEGDWEHITIHLKADGSFDRARYAQHDGGTTYHRAELEWNGDHPKVYSATGTHASYPHPGEYTFPAKILTLKNHATADGPVWTGGLINVGDRGHVLHGETFIEYGGLWGRPGGVFNQDGPPTPSFQGAWSTE
jgi:hypothetical protein